MRLPKAAAALFAAAALSATMLAGCSSTSSSAPQNVTFDTSTGAFTFDAVDGGSTYTVGVSKILNDETGEALESINGSATIDLGGDTGTVHVWSEQTGSVSGLSDTDGDGTVDGTVVFREFSSSASTVGDVISMDQLPVGHYVLSVVPSATDDLPNPETAYYEFSIDGTLAEPAGFTAQVNDEGYMEITAPSDYYLTCLTETGMPHKMQFEVKDGDEVVETIELSDFSYTNTVNGPNKSFTFNNQTVTGTTKLEDGKDYTVTVTAVGDGDQIGDASAEAYMATSTEAVSFASESEVTGSGTVGDYTVAVTLGTDASGANVYELTASVNDTAILRESGTFTATDDSLATGAQLTFATSATDADAAVLDGVTLTVAEGQAQRMGPGGPGGSDSGSVTYYLEGTASLNGESFELAQSSGGMGGFGPM